MTVNILTIWPNRLDEISSNLYLELARRTKQEDPLLNNEQAKVRFYIWKCLVM